MYSSHKILTLDNINPHYNTNTYPIRGRIDYRATEIEEELSAGIKKPFYEIIYANSGDSQGMGQEPITFLRQVLALCVQPELMDSFDFPDDAKQRARAILNSCNGGSIGAYTDGQGNLIIRKQVARYIKLRDGIDSDFNDIFLTEGATHGIKKILALLNCGEHGKPPGIMVPVPEYPLFTITLAENGMKMIRYPLDEANNWAIDIAELRTTISGGRKEFAIRAIVIINPGNPTGHVLTYDNIMAVIELAYEEKLILLADEVYQQNIYDKNLAFHSVKKTMMDMGSPYSEMELVSFNSTSKGFLGECGIRGGYMEVCNFEPEIKTVLLNLGAAMLSPNTPGQIAVSVMVNPPRVFDPSYKSYTEEKTNVMNSFKERARLVSTTFNTFEGFSCNLVNGAFYAFPQIKMPLKAVEAATKVKMDPDVFYALELLENTGICVVPGSIFTKKVGSCHLRTTILPQMSTLKIMMSRFHEFHISFMEKYK